MAGEGEGEGILDEVAVLHQYGARSTLNGVEGTATVAAEPGRQARIRIVNTDNGVATVWVRGTSYRVLAVDGTDLHEPEPVDGAARRGPGRGKGRPGADGAGRRGTDRLRRHHRDGARRRPDRG